MSDMQPQGSYQSAAELDELHETTDLNIKEVVGYTVVLVVLCAVTFLGIKLVMDHFATQTARNQALKSSRFVADVPPAGPRLQANPGKETKEIAAAALNRLNAYGWVDRDAQLAHIPIDRAIDILAKSGLPKRGKVDKFHPLPGSTKPEKVGVPEQPAAPPTEAAPSTGPTP